jgi:hypothetical protein
MLKLLYLSVWIHVLECGCIGAKCGKFPCATASSADTHEDMTINGQAESTRP